MIQSVLGNPVSADYSYSVSLVRSAVQTAKQGEGGVRSSNTETQNSSALSGSVSDLTTEQQREVDDLKKTDRQVRAHEQAHLSVGGGLIRGGATFSYTTGPDEKRYAVAGEVSIDTSPAATPDETLPKAMHIRATALAPADPSPQDRSVAAQATQMENEARREIAALRQQELQDNTETDSLNRAGLYRSVQNGDSSLNGTNLNVFA